MKIFAKNQETEYDKWYRKFAFVPVIVGIRQADNKQMLAWLEFYEWRALKSGADGLFQTFEFRPIPSPPEITPFTDRQLMRGCE